MVDMDKNFHICQKDDTSFSVSCVDLGVNYGKEVILSGINFVVRPGESLSIVGSSGSGKSSLLNVIYGILPKEYVFGEINIEPFGTKKAYVMQEYGLFPWKTLVANIELPLVLEGMAKDKRREIIMPLLAELDLNTLKNRYPHELSGGQRQRIALGRALAAGANLILLDEPFSSLDAITRERLQESVREIFTKRGLSYIIATHSIEEAVFLGDTVIVLGGSPSKIVASIKIPGRKEKDFRYQDSFFKLVKDVREVLEKWEVVNMDNGKKDIDGSKNINININKSREAEE